MDKDDDPPVTLAKDVSQTETPHEPLPVDDAPADEAPAGGAEAPLEAFVAGAAYAALGLLGLVVAILGSFSQDWTVADLPVAAVALVLLNFGVVRLSGWGMRSRMGAVIPAVVWMLVVVVMSMQRAEGDLIVPGTLAGYIYIVGGLAGAVIGVGTTRARHPSGQWLTAGAGRTRG